MQWRGGCVPCVKLRGGCVACVALCCVAVAFRGGCVSLCLGRCASSQAVLFRFGWLFPAAPGLSVLVPCSAEHKIGIFVRFLASDPHFQAFRAQNWHFCVRMGDFSEIFGRFDTKMGFLCSGSITMVVPANHRALFESVNPL